MGTEDDDLPVVGEVGGLEVSTLCNVQPPHAAVGELDRFALNIDDLRSVLEAEAIIDLGAYGLQERDLIADCLGVAVDKFHAPSGAFATGLHTGLAAPDHDDVVAEAEEAVEHTFAEALAVTEQQDNSDKPPDYSEHGESGAQAAAQER